MDNRVVVRCLGPGKEDHYFRSVDKSGNRICPKCAIKIAALNLSLLCSRQPTVVDNHRKSIVADILPEPTCGD